MNGTINIVLADDHVLVRNGIKAMLESDPDIRVVGEAGSGAEALEVARQLHPNILVLDIRMPGMTGLEASARPPEVAPDTTAVTPSTHGSGDYWLPAPQACAYR